MSSFMTCAAYQRRNEMGDIDIAGGGERCKQGLAGKPEEPYSLEGLGICGGIILKRNLNESVERLWNGWIYFRIGTSDGLLVMQ